MTTPNDDRYTWIGDDRPNPLDERYSDLPAEYYRPFYDPSHDPGDMVDKSGQMAEINDYQADQPEPQDDYEPGERARRNDRDYMGSGPSPDDIPDDYPDHRVTPFLAKVFGDLGMLEPWDLRILGYQPGNTMRRHHDSVKYGHRQNRDSYKRIRQRERSTTHSMESVYQAAGVKTRRERSKLRNALRKDRWI